MDNEVVSEATGLVVEEASKEDEEKFEQLKRSIGYEKFEKIRQSARHFFVTYMVWIFHMVILLGMSFEKGDFFSMALFCIDSVVFISHLYLTWVCNTEERNNRMRRWWYPSFIMVIVLICLRYLSFYTRYLTIRRLYVQVLHNIGFISDSDPNKLFNQTSAFSRLFIKNNNIFKIDRLFEEFYLELFYLGSSCLTLISLSMSLIEEKKEGSDGRKSSANVDLVVPNNLTEPISENEVNGYHGLNGKDHNHLNGDSPAKKQGAAKAAPKEEPPKPQEQSIDRKYFIIFFCTFIMLRSFSFIFVVYSYDANMDILNFLFISSELVYFNLLFWNLANVQEAFDLEKFVMRSLEYFKRSFVDKLITHNALLGTQKLRKKLFNDPYLAESDFDEYIADSEPTENGESVSTKDAKNNKAMSHNIVRDLEQNKYYLDQFLVKVEKEVINISTHISFLKVIIITVKGYFLLGDFIYQIYSGKELATKVSEQNRGFMLQNTLLMTLILTELLVVKHYLNSSDETKPFEETTEKLSKFVVMIISKLEYYSFFAAYKIKEYVNEAKIAQDQSNNDRGSKYLRGSSFFDLANLSIVGEKKAAPKQFKASSFMRRKETVEDRMRSERISVDLQELWVKEKKSLFKHLRELYLNFLAAQVQCSKAIQRPFDSSYGEYCFEDPQVRFKHQGLSKQKTNESGEEEMAYDEAEDYLEAEEEKKYSFAMGEGTTRLLKFLFVHRNTHKYKFCMFLAGISYFLRRLMLFPILYIVSIDSKLSNLPVLLVGIIYALRGSKTVTSDLKLFMPIFSLLFMFLFLICQGKNLWSPFDLFKQIGFENRNPLIVMSTFFSLIAMSFNVMILLAYFIVDHLMVISKRQAEIYFSFHLERGKEVLKVDFLEWNTSVFSGFNLFFSLIYDHLLDYYMVMMYLISVLNQSMYNTLLLVLVLFMITSQMVPSLKKYSIKSFAPEKLRNFTYIFNLVIFVLLANYTLAGFLKNSGAVSKIEFWKRLLEQTLLSFLWVVILNFTIADFMNSEDFKSEKTLLNKKNELHTKFAALHQAYHDNEEVIYQRVKLIKKLRELDGIEKNFFANVNNWKNLKFESQYWQKDMVNIIQRREEDLRRKYLPSWLQFKSRLAENLYNYCYRRTSVSFFEDFLFLLLQVFGKNQFLLRGGIINISDYYSGDFAKYENVFKDISNFYHGLKNKETLPSNTYRNKYNELMKRAAQQFRKKDEPASSRKEQSEAARERAESQEETAKDRQDLKRAANFLYSILLHEQVSSEENTAQGSDFMVCNFGEHRIKFYNLTMNLMKSSMGYQQIRLGVLVKIFSMFLVSRSEYLVSVLIIVLQIYKGAIENFVIIGIVFFGILVETHHGHSKWWSVLFYIYLVKCSMAYTFENLTSSQKEMVNQGVLSMMLKAFFILVGSPSYGLDALILISIFVLNQVLRMKGFSEKYLVEFEDPGTCIARVDSADPALHKRPRGGPVHAQAQRPPGDLRPENELHRQAPAGRVAQPARRHALLDDLPQRQGRDKSVRGRVRGPVFPRVRAADQAGAERPLRGFLREHQELHVAQLRLLRTRGSPRSRKTARTAPRPLSAYSWWPCATSPSSFPSSPARTAAFSSRSAPTKSSPRTPHTFSCLLCSA